MGLTMGMENTVKAALRADTDAPIRQNRHDLPRWQRGKFPCPVRHGSIEDHRARVQSIRAIEEKYGRPIAILMDLQGPKLRVATFAKGPVMLKAGQSFRLDMDKTPGDITRVGLPHKEVFAALAPKQDLLINDGKIRLHITQASPRRATAVVDVAGRISNRKGESSQCR
jgi:pyruvate kinase